MRIRVDKVRAGVALMVLLCRADHASAQAPAPPSRRGGARGEIVGRDLSQFVQPEVPSGAPRVGRLDDAAVLGFENTRMPASGRSSGTPVAITTQYKDQTRTKGLMLGKMLRTDADAPNRDCPGAMARVKAALAMLGASRP